MIPFTDLKSQYLEAKTDIDAAIAKVIDTTSYIAGPLLAEFETAFATYTSAQACAGTSSGSTALMCALMAAGIGAGDEVITTPHTFISTGEAIIWQQAIPVFVDIDANYQIDVSKIPERITSKTKAILFVSMYGQCPDLAALKKIAADNNLLLIEDAAQSVGTTYNGQPTSAYVDMSCYSFNPVKNLGAMGDAGAVVGSAQLIDRVKMFRDHGRENKWDFETQGINGRMDTLQAQVVLAKMPYVDRWISKKREISQRYNQYLSAYVTIPAESDWAYHTYYVYVIQVPERDKFVSYMKDNGVAVNVHYPLSLVQQPVFRDYITDCPVANDACSKIVSLPCYHTLTETQQDKIIELVISWSKLH